MKYKRVCVRCKKEFECLINKANKGHYCSIECYRGRTETVPANERFWSKVNILTTGEMFAGEHCWLWMAAKDAYGHGMFNKGRRGQGTTTAHRVAWEITNGSIGDGLDVDHCCSNTACVNPKHLQLVTKKQHGHLGSPNGNRLNPTGFRGVRPNHARWMATIAVKKEIHYLGTFDTSLEAAKAYNKACIKLLSPEAAQRRLNKLD